jgi:hypothetical protein
MPKFSGRKAHPKIRRAYKQARNERLSSWLPFVVLGCMIVVGVTSSSLC